MKRNKRTRKSEGNEMGNEKKERGDSDERWGPIFEILDGSSVRSTADSVLEVVAMSGSIRGRML